MKKINADTSTDSDHYDGVSMHDAADQIGHNSKHDIPLHLRIAEVYLGWISTVGKSLKWVPDADGNPHYWKSENGIWKLLPADADVMKWMESDHRKIIDGIGSTKKTAAKLFSEAAKCVMRSQFVRDDVSGIEWDAHGKIPTNNGLIDPVTLEMEPIRPEHYATWKIDVDYDPSATCPKWLQLLEEFFSDQTDDDRRTNINLLQELAGMGLVNAKPKSLRKALILLGPSDSGKSNVLNVMAGLISPNPITATFKQLEGSHGTWPFINRAPWIQHEAFSQSEWLPSTVVKSLISGDVIPINVKNGPIMSVAFNGPVFWGSNHAPQFKENTSAIRNRLILIATTKVFDADNPVGLGAEARSAGVEPSDIVLASEKQGLFNWALAGLKRAMARGHFINTKTGENLLNEVEEESNRVKRFIRDCGEFDCTKMISTHDFYAAFVAWWLDEVSADEGRIPEAAQVGLWLKSANYPLIAMDRDKFRDRDGVRFYPGLVLNQMGKERWREASQFPPARFGVGLPVSTKISRRVEDVCRDIPAAWLDHLEVVRVRLRSRRDGA